jgi:hypothetical protein
VIKYNTFLLYENKKTGELIKLSPDDSKVEELKNNPDWIEIIPDPHLDIQ